MPLIQAYRRVKATTVDLPPYLLKFTPNDLGHIVCDVPEDAVEKLLAIPTGFRAYGEAVEPIVVMSPVLDMKPIEAIIPPPPLTPPPPIAAPEGGNVATKSADSGESPYVLVNGEARLDLRPMSDDELRAFAKENGIAVHHACKGDTIRDKIVEGLKADGAVTTPPSGA